MGLLTGFNDLTGWTLLQKNTAALETGYAAGGSDRNDIAYFRSVAPTLTTPDKLLGNYRALTFVATAFGLGDQVNQTAILRKLLTQDPTDSSSLAQQLADNNYRAFAGALAEWSPPPFSSQATIDSVVARFQEKSFETSVGTDNPALREARYFTENIQGVTKLSQIVADPALLDVVRTALGIPKSFGNLSYDQQVAILTPRVDLKQFGTTDGIAAFVTRYLSQDELDASKDAAASSPLLALFKGSGGASAGLTLNASTLNLLA